MKTETMLTTFDNPFNPFEDFDEWFLFDVEKGYNSCSVLARIIKTDETMTQKEIDEANEKAIDEIIKHDFLNVFTKVTREVEEDSNAD